MVLSIPKINAGTFLFPLNNTSENHPEKTVPTMPSKALMDMIWVADERLNPFSSCRNNTPQPLMAYRLTYMNALERARIHT